MSIVELHSVVESLQYQLVTCDNLAERCRINDALVAAMFSLIAAYQRELVSKAA